jgi:hypothetical protein
MISHSIVPKFVQKQALAQGLRSDSLQLPDPDSKQRLRCHLVIDAGCQIRECD